MRLHRGHPHREVFRQIAPPWLSADDIPRMMARACKCIGRGLGKLIGMTEAQRVEYRAWHLQSIDGPTPEEAKAERRRGSIRGEGLEGCGKLGGQRDTASVERRD